MASNLSNGFAIYPMVEEGEATGVVAGVYAELLTRMPFVPSLYKSFALCPTYLVLAYEQSAGVLDGDALEAAGHDLGASVRDVVQPPAQQEVRETLAQFVGPLGRMLLLSSGLLLALHGELDAPSAPGQAPPPRSVEADQPPPSQWDAPWPKLYGCIRAALDTPIVNTIWRELAAKGQLEDAWAALSPQVASSRSIADDLQARAVEVARGLTSDLRRDARAAKGSVFIHLLVVGDQDRCGGGTTVTLGLSWAGMRKCPSLSHGPRGGHVPFPSVRPSGGSGHERRLHVRGRPSGP
jgi:hypothetical protein